MPIILADIDKFYLTGGAANSDTAASLGGAVSSVAITTNTLQNLFDLVTTEDATTGDVEYRCLAVKNSNSDMTLINSTIWINSNTVSADTTLDIGLAVEGANSSPELLANESTPPAGVVFSSPTTKETGLVLGDLTAGSTYPIWVRRTINSDATPIVNDSVSIGFGGEMIA